MEPPEDGAADARTRPDASDGPADPGSGGAAATSRDRGAAGPEAEVREGAVPEAGRSGDVAPEADERQGVEPGADDRRSAAPETGDRPGVEPGADARQGAAPEADGGAVPETGTPVSGESGETGAEQSPETGAEPPSGTEPAAADPDAPAGGKAQAGGPWAGGAEDDEGGQAVDAARDGGTPAGKSELAEDGPGDGVGVADGGAGDGVGVADASAGTGDGAGGSGEAGDGDADDLGGISALSMPSRVLLALVIAAVAVGAVFHLGMVFLSVAPPNTLSEEHNQALDAYVYPEFEQNWKLFAPNPVEQNTDVDARAEVRTPGGALETTGWVDLTAMDIANIRHNPIPSHTVQNELRRAWGFYSDTHDNQERPIGLRGDLSQEYLLRIVAHRFGSRLNGGTVQRVELRLATTPLGSPPWDSQKTSTTTSYRVLPWWAVSAEDFT